MQTDCRLMYTIRARFVLSQHMLEPSSLIQSEDKEKKQKGASNSPGRLAR